MASSLTVVTVVYVQGHVAVARAALDELLMRLSSSVQRHHVLGLPGQRPDERVIGLQPSVAQVFGSHG